MFNHTAFMTEMIERQRSRKAPDATARYQDAHSDTSLISVLQSFCARRVELAADQDEATVAVFALNEILVAHLIPDAWMPEGTSTTIARYAVGVHHDDFWRVKHIAVRGHDL